MLICTFLRRMGLVCLLAVRPHRRALLVGALGRHTTAARAQALELVDSLGNEGVREGQLWSQPAVSLPLDTFLQK